MKQLFINVDRNNKNLFLKYDLRSKIEGADLFWKDHGCTLWDYKYKIGELTNGQKKYRMELEIQFVINGEKSPKIGIIGNWQRKRRIKKLQLDKSVPIDPALKSEIRSDK